MPRQSNYELLKDVHTIVNRMEDKLNADINQVEKRVDIVESKLNVVIGKIGIAVAAFTILLVGLVNFVFDWIRSRFL